MATSPFGYLPILRRKKAHWLLGMKSEATTMTTTDDDAANVHGNKE